MRKMFIKNVILIQVLLVATISCYQFSSGTSIKEEANDAVVVKRNGPSAAAAASSSSSEETGKLNKKFYSNSNKEVMLEDEDDDDEQADVLSRFQRTDSHHNQQNSRYHVYMNDNRKKQEHKQHQKNGFENYLERNRNLFLNLNNNDDLFADDVKKFEEEMNVNELRKFMKENLKYQEDEMGAQPSEMMNALSEKPVKHVQVKEKLMREDEYNRQFQSKNDDISNPFFEQDVSMDSLNAGLSQQQAINENPSMINKQQAQPNVDPNLNSKIESLKQQNDYLFMFVLAGCILAGVVALIAAGVCWYTVHKSYKSNPAEYGVKIGKFNSSMKSNSSSSGDRRLAQSAQMYHYQHQKQQMIAMEKANNDTKPDNSDNSEGETEEGDYTVYECPGLAPTGEMEVKNPLFKEDFSQSLNNIHSTTLPPPPAYSSLTTASESEQQKSSEAESPQAPAAVAAAPATETSSVSINLNDEKQN